MERKPLFIINGELLFVEFYLINVNYPECFVCIDEHNNRYLVLLTDFDTDNYIITSIAPKYLKKMICGEIPMKNPFETAKIIYSIKPSENPINDEVSRVYFSQIKNICDWFYGEDYYFDKQYINNADEYLEKLNQITTNFKKLKSMTQDEAVKYIKNELCKIYEGCDDCPMYHYVCLKDEFVEWLEMPVKEIR